MLQLNTERQLNHINTLLMIIFWFHCSSCLFMVICHSLPPCSLDYILQHLHLSCGSYLFPFKALLHSLLSSQTSRAISYPSSCITTQHLTVKQRAFALALISLFHTTAWETSPFMQFR